MRASSVPSLAGLAAAVLLSASAARAAKPQPPLPNQKELDGLMAQYAPVDLGVDLGKLSDADKKVLKKLVEASRVMDTIFLGQVWSGNPAMKAQLEKDHSPLGKARLAFFIQNAGPWDRLDANKVFLPGAPAQKPPQAGFYPDDAKKDDVAKWMASLPKAEQEKAKGFFSVVERDKKGFKLVPYSKAYAAELKKAAKLLEEAAALATEPSLKSFLELRAKAFLNDDYYDSDVAWMKLDSKVDPTIGPYEVYEDEWFNYKAAFESFICVRNDEETKKLARFSKQLQDIEDHLPEDPKFRSKKLGGLAPIRVVDVVFDAGDGNRGIQTAAYNLPNDDHVTAKMGSKRVMLKNMQEQKFHAVLVPISKVALSAADQKKVSFDSFFTHILMHELMHGLGPHEIVKGGKKTTPREQLTDAYSAIEEAKADVTGLWAMQYLVDKGVLDKSFEKSMYQTYLASTFRAIRFGLSEAHGKGIAIQLNTYLDKGGYVVGKDGRFSVNEKKIKAAVAGLAHELLTIEANGDAAGARKLIQTRAVVRPAVQKIINELKGVPVDVDPHFVTAAKLEAMP